MAKQKTSALAALAAQDRGTALDLFPLPGNMEARFAVYAELLQKWQKTINLVAPSTLPQLWTRHFADSLQVQATVPEARVFADLGSGAGFPGLVTAIRLAEVAGASVHLIESDQRKCAFLREVSRETSAPAEVHHGRIETVLPGLRGIEVLTARGLAPLPKLLAYSARALENGAVGVFLKGERLDIELTEAERLDSLSAYEWGVIRSRTSKMGRILIVKQKIK